MSDAAPATRVCVAVGSRLASHRVATCHDSPQSITRHYKQALLTTAMAYVPLHGIQVPWLGNELYRHATCMAEREPHNME